MRLDGPLADACLTVDYVHRRSEVELSNGLVISQPFSPRVSDHQGDIARAKYESSDQNLTLDFQWGEHATFDIGSTIEIGRPVVYLDQNHWVKLACHQWSPDKIPARHRDGYARLFALARDQAILLPLSAAHAVETARTDGRWRRDLATTMLQLSRGWQMRSPLKVRHQELYGDMALYRTGAQTTPQGLGVFTLDPGALFASDEHIRATSPEGELTAHLTWTTSFAEMLIEDEREDDDQARAKIAAWAAAYGAVSAHLREAQASKEDIRVHSQIALLTDLTDDVIQAAARAGLQPTELDSWCEQSEDRFVDLPYIGRLQQITHQRLRNHQYRWEDNDLNDMHFLSCAAGYADLLLAEKDTSHQLRAAEPRVSAGAYVCRSPAEAVERIEHILS